jgi:predicted AlkP superfamily phosphohydrolase/phosphomutase
MKQLTRRDFIKDSAIAATSLATGLGARPSYALTKKSAASNGKKVIVIGFDGMDPGLCERLMAQGKLPNLERLRQAGGYSRLATSTPPQSPVAWANFINGAGPGSHGIFDFIHRDPENQTAPFFSAAETIEGDGYIEMGDHKIPLEFWPFNHTSAKTVLKRQGTPFWDYLDKVGIESTFYDLPSNYPPSPSKYGHHRCLAGMGTPDLMGSYGTYQYFTEDGPDQAEEADGEIWSRIVLNNETSESLSLEGPVNTNLIKPEPVSIDFLIHRDIDANAVVIEIQGKTLLLKQGEWSNWVDLDFTLSAPAILPDTELKGICRFYVQEIAPTLKLYVSPLNADPSDPSISLTEPPEFSRTLSDSLGAFPTTGFQEDHKALSNGAFTDEEFIVQAESVLDERLQLLDYALTDFDDGLLFFYFSSTDLQAHMLWWDSDAEHPTRSADEAKTCFAHLHNLYVRMDQIVGDLITQYGDDAHLIVMSDHGFANFRRTFNLNSWLCQQNYIYPATCSSILEDADWSKTRAYGLGINSLYLNLKGREKFGVVSPDSEREELLNTLIVDLEAIRDVDGKQVILKVYRSDELFFGPALKYAPDLIIGYSGDYRASNETCLGTLSEEVLADNDSAWAADHCMDPTEVPGVLFSNRPISSRTPSLIDIAPSILTEFGVEVPATMTGRSIFDT